MDASIVPGERAFTEMRKHPTQTGTPEAGGCPENHTAYSAKKSLRAGDSETGRAPVEQDAAGVWRVRSFAAAREILRERKTRQAGFKADLIANIPGAKNKPVLYQEGKEHQEQRKQTARFFSPTATSANYRAFMETLADAIVAQLQRKGRADLSDLSMELAVEVAARVVGLTDSRFPGLDRRLDAFFQENVGETSWTPRGVYTMLKTQWHMGAFFFLDVQPAITARRKQPQADVISYLLGKNYSSPEILTECVTYGAAGMATTREFICMAAWHMLEHPDLRARYLAAGEEERHTILHEILRLEPVVGHLQRRAEEEIVLDVEGVRYVIPAGALIDLEIEAANVEEALVGAEPLRVVPDRELKADKVHRAVLSFGDGHHRCPGAYVAIQESDILLTRLLALPTLRVVRAPELTWSELTAGYELRRFVVAVG